MEQKTKMGWKKYLLIASLGLNLLIAFAVGGAFLKSGGPDRMKSDVFLQGAMIRALPDEKRELLRSGFKDHRDKHKKENGSFRAMRTELNDVIIAVPFSADALNDILVKQRDMRAGFALSGDAALVNVISQMTDAERADFAANIKFRKMKRKKK
jgi:uncharacterized membrane protein